MRVRLALHAGSLFPAGDHVTGGPLFNGTHLRQAAGILPVAGEGEVCASEPFAALAAIEHIPGFRSEFACERTRPGLLGTDRYFLLRPASGS